MLSNDIWTKIELWQPITLVICLLFSSFFSAAETALTSISPTKAVQLMGSGLKRAAYLKYWFNHTSEIITTILIGNNCVNIAASALTTLIAQKLFSSAGIAVTLGIMTMYLLTFGEIIPKVFARANAVKLSLLFIPILMVFYYVFYPITFIFVYITEKIFKSTTLHDRKRNPMITLKDLDFFISLAQKEGSLIGSKKGMYLKAVSEFSELKVKNIMIPESRVAVIHSDIEIDELIKLIKKDMYTRYPVINDNDNFIGILNVKDFLINLEKCEQEKSVLSILRPSLWTNEFMKVDYVLELMKAKKTQLFLVKNEYNRFSGIITMEDILEELVGEIEDEHDEMTDSSDSLDTDNVFITSGEDSIHDLNIKYNLGLPEDKDFQTLNGFILSLFNGVLPKKDTIISWEKLRIRILKNKDKNIEKAEITVI
jgi:CBS domain containing-hemolysin-like protein